VADLKNALNEGESWPTVKELYQAVVAYGGAPPAKVMEQYRKRSLVERETAAAGWRDVVIVIGVAGVAIVAAACFVGFILLRR
jgi:hypothetical protein